MPPESTLVSEEHAAVTAIEILVVSGITRCHGDIQSRAAAEGHVCVCGPTAARFYINICGITKVHANARGLGRHLEPCWCPMNTLPLGPCKPE